MTDERFRPDPRQLWQDALSELRKRELDDYLDAIKVLKDEKEFTFREIAVWLQQHGLSVDHNAVWRAYTAGMRPGEAALVEEQDEIVERDEAYKQAWAEGNVVTSTPAQEADKQTGESVAPAAAEKPKNACKERKRTGRAK